MLKIRDLKKSFAQPDGGRLDILDIPQFNVDEGEQVVDNDDLEAVQAKKKQKK